ncbi:hypothetical protein FB451DRAFT_1339818 [Mycena latifolia]|nr:hypothetical protein FB451DRAFT_1339818 [Mycena latifolia]
MSRLLTALRFIFLHVLPDQLFSRLPTTRADVAGRAFLVTGANTGLGRALAVHLARQGPAALVLGVRDLTKGEEARAAIVKETGFGGTVHVWALDQADFASVRAFAARAKKELGRLDGAVLNAGVRAGRWEVTKDGWEKTLQVNVLSTGLLGVLLLPLLQSTARLAPPHPGALQTPPHLTITGSAAMALAFFPERSAPNILETLNDPAKSALRPRYVTSKLLDLFLAREIAALPHAAGVVVNIVDPGLCRSELTRDFQAGLIFRLFQRYVGWPTSQGALNLLYGVLAPTPPGAYVGACAIREPPAWTMSAEGVRVQRKTWREMVGVWRAVAPEVEGVVESE